MLNFYKFFPNMRHSLLTALLILLASCGYGMNEQEMLIKAKEHIGSGDLKAASLELRNTLQKNNKNAEARYLLATISMQIGDFEAAMKDLRHAQRGGWDNEQIQNHIAQILIFQKKFQQLLNEVTINDNWTVETRANITALQALAEAGLGHTALAKNSLAKASSIKSDAFQVLKTTAIFQYSKLLDGNPGETINQALATYPDNAELLLIHASIETDNKNFDSASATYKKIINQSPPNLILINGITATIGLARIQVAQKKFEEAKTSLSQILSINENNPESNFLTGLIEFNNNNYDQAEIHLRKVLTILPEHLQTIQLMGKIKYASREYSQAEQYFSQYLKAAPDDLNIQKLLAQTYIILKQPERAETITSMLQKLEAPDSSTLTLQTQIQLSKGDFNAGIESLLKAIEINPKNVTLHKQLIKTYISQGKTQLALEQIKKLKSLNIDNKTIQQLTIFAYMHTGKYYKAIDIANNMLDKDPENANILALLGTLHASTKDNMQARYYFDKALKLQNRNLQATMGLAVIEKEEGHQNKARSLYKGLVKANVGGTLPMLALSEMAALENDENEMLHWLEEARTSSDDDMKSRSVLANYYLYKENPNKANSYVLEMQKISPENRETLSLLGKTLNAQKRYNEALQPLQKLVSKSTSPSNANIFLGEAYLGLNKTEAAREELLSVLKVDEKHLLALSLLSTTEMKDGNFDASLEYARRLQKAYPGLYIGFMHEGNAMLAKNDFSGAHKAYQKAWGIKPSAKLARHLFISMIKNNSFEDSISTTQSWLEKNPEDISMRTFLAIQYQATGRNELAIREYEAALKIQPDNSTTLNNLAWLYYLEGNSNALDLAEQAYRITPASPGIQDTYGWILVNSDQIAKGKRLIKQAHDILPDNIEIKYHYAVALARSGNKTEAKKLLGEILAQDKPFSAISDAKQLHSTL